MRRLWFMAVPVVALLTLLLSAFPTSAAAPAASNPPFTLHLPATANGVTLNPFVRFDISWVDAQTQTYVVADASNAGLDVFNAATNRFLRSTGGFQGVSPTSHPGCSRNGPDGVLIVPPGEQHGDGPQATGGRGVIWAGDGDSSLKAVDLNSGAIIATVPINLPGSNPAVRGACRTDEIAYDGQHHELMAANDNDSPPFITVISTISPYPVLGTLLFDGGAGAGHAGNATNGLEQPIYDATTGTFFITVPATVANPGGEVDEITATAPIRVLHVLGLPAGCAPTGFAQGPQQQALVGCHTAAGAQLITLSPLSLGPSVAGAGGADEVWYNPGSGHYYAPTGLLPAAGGCAESTPLTTQFTPTVVTVPVTNACVAVIDAASATVINAVQLPPLAGSHSVAANAANNEVFVPVRDLSTVHDQGIAVFQDGAVVSPPQPDGDRQLTALDALCILRTVAGLPATSNCPPTSPTP